MDRLIVYGSDDWKIEKLSLLRTDQESRSLDQAGIDHLTGFLSDHRPDLLVLDPLIIFSGGGDIDDDAVMALVMMELKRMAGKFDCAVMIVHHMTKGRGLNSVDIRGTSTAIMAIPMTAEEAKQLRVTQSETWRYFKVASKSKLTPPSDDAPWYERVNVELPNAEPPYKTGDEVTVAVRAKLSPGSKGQ